MVAVHFRQNDGHDDDYGKILPVRLFDNKDEAVKFLETWGYKPTGKDQLTRYDYHSEVVATIHKVVE
jgi:hypothetical protein